MASDWDVLIEAGPHDHRYRPAWTQLFDPEFHDLAEESEVATRVDDDAGTMQAQAVVRVRAADSAEAEAIARHGCREAGLTAALDDGQVDPPDLMVTVFSGDQPFDEALEAIYAVADGEEW